MNFIFLNPVWLAALLPIILGGWQLLRAGRPPTAIFTVPEFWPARSALASMSDSHSRKAPDWPQVGLLLAATVAALALARPAWKINRHAPALIPQFHAVGRQLKNQSAAQVFVRGDTLKWEHFVIRIAAGKTTLIRRVNNATMRRGVMFTGVPAIAPMKVIIRAVKSSGQESVLTHITLIRRVTPRPLTIISPSPLPRSLQHLLLLMHNTVWNHPRQLPAIWILSNTADYHRYQDFLQRLSRKPGGLVVLCLGAAAGPRMKVSGILRVTPTDHPVIIQPDGRLFHRVNFSAIRINQMYQASFETGWHAEIRVGSHVWLAKRADSADRIIWYWLASPPADGFTDWQHHASFVIFFARLLASLTHATVDSGQIWWRANKESRLTTSGKSGTTMASPDTAERFRPLTPALALTSAILIGISLIGLVGRKARPR